MATSPKELVTSDSEIMGGVPVFAGTRVPIDIVLASLAAGIDMSRIRTSYPFLTQAHVEEARAYAETHPDRNRPQSISEAHPDWIVTERRVVRPPRADRTPPLEEHTPEQRKLMNRWLKMSDLALRDSQYDGVSESTRCKAAFDAGYVCALYVLGPTALQLDNEQPSRKVLRAAARVANVDVSPGLLHLEHGLDDPLNMPSLEELFRWAQLMRKLVPVERACAMSPGPMS